jgi:uncharacterized protein
MKKIFNIKGMHCNSCANNIENELKDKVNSIHVDFSNEIATIDFNEKMIHENEIKKIIKKIGYELEDKANTIKENVNKPNKFGWIFFTISLVLLLILAYYLFSQSINLPNIKIPESGDNIGLVLLFLAGIITGFHCISMCGAFVLSYTSKNAIKGHTGYAQHFIYGTSKVLSYAIIGGIFGLIGGIFAFSIGLRGTVAILAGIFMIFYALSLFGLKFFRKFQINPKFLTKFTLKAGQTAKGPYKAPFITGLLNGLFIACGPLQAMYLYAAGTGSFLKGASSLAVFGLGTLPIMIGFGSLATVISHNTTKKILKFSAIIVLILGLIMLNRGLTLIGSNYNFDSIKEKITPTNINPTNSGTRLENDYQIINMDVDASGYHPNSFVLKKGVPVKWNVNVKELTGCNEELIMNEYNINKNLKQGLNLIEFTPEKVETIPFNCGMGMLHGSFIVTASGTANQAQVKAVAPKSSGTCNMGNSGGGCGCK